MDKNNSVSRVEIDVFLEELSEIIKTSKGSKSTYLTFKKVSFQPLYRVSKIKSKGEPFEPGKIYCLVRAKIGKRRLSTLVDGSSAVKFHIALGKLLKDQVQKKMRQKR